MKRILPFVAATLVCLPLAPPDKPARPKITGIDHVRIYVTDIGKASVFYAKFVGPPTKTAY